MAEVRQPGKWFPAPRQEKRTYTGPMALRTFEVGQQARLKTALEPPVNIPAGTIGSVVRVLDWDVWVRFDKGVARLPIGEVKRA